MTVEIQLKALPVNTPLGGVLSVPCTLHFFNPQIQEMGRTREPFWRGTGERSPQLSLLSPCTPRIFPPHPFLILYPHSTLLT
ncbi:GPI-anchored surface protein, putative [Bodo saltans]|uniref:GPI-anchored surface protein, putative n=1 Tax=Bodo saltans TaxID=75058 RepID=A0A0S4JUN4_BODSA|nr:GPI-anchored surface protein, putative [Bodo saltans]|eukprot:CUG93929.1 GPI-anchored surface protein, putative [Bodo saltans]